MSTFKTFASSSTSNSTSNSGGNTSSTNASSRDSSLNDLDDLASYKVDPYSNAITNGYYTTVPNWTTSTSTPAITINSPNSSGSWATSISDGSLFYKPDNSFEFHLDVSDLASTIGFVKCVEGLDNSILLTDEQSTIVKLWESEEDSPEKFFVLGAINGCLDLDTVIALSEVSLKALVGKTFYGADNVEGMSKWFFKIISRTDYLDEWVLDDKFLQYWVKRLQNFQHNNEAKEIVKFMLKMLFQKRQEDSNNSEIS